MYLDAFLYIHFSVLLFIAAEKIPYGQNLIVLIIDGYGASLMNQSQHSNLGLRSLQEKGAYAGYLKPVYPTYNYPNWMSLFTGLYPENHGYMGDYMWNRKEDSVFVKGEINGSYESWYTNTVEPVWYTVGKANVDVHCYWIAECHKPYRDMIVQVPEEKKYNASLLEQTEALPSYFSSIIERILKYQPYKQQLFLLRYAGVQNALKTFGIGSDEAENAILTADHYIMELQRRLNDANLFEFTNFMVISPHGLHTVDRKREQPELYIENCFMDYSKIQKIVNSQAMMMIYTAENVADEVMFELKTCESLMEEGDYDDADKSLIKVYNASELPERFHWKNGRFMSEIVLITRPGITIWTRELPAVPEYNGEKQLDQQSGGWDNEHEHMRGIFMAMGPAFKSGYQVPFVDIVDIYQVILNIFGIEPPHRHNGTWSNMEELMSTGWDVKSIPEKKPSSASTFLALSSCIYEFLFVFCFSSLL